MRFTSNFVDLEPPVIHTIAEMMPFSNMRQPLLKREKVPSPREITAYPTHNKCGRQIIVQNELRRIENIIRRPKHALIKKGGMAHRIGDLLTGWV